MANLGLSVTIFLFFFNQTSPQTWDWNRWSPNPHTYYYGRGRAFDNLVNDTLHILWAYDFWPKSLHMWSHDFRRVVRSLPYCRGYCERFASKIDQEQFHLKEEIGRYLRHYKAKRYYATQFIIRMDTMLWDKNWFFFQLTSELRAYGKGQKYEINYWTSVSLNEITGHIKSYRDVDTNELEDRLKRAIDEYTYYELS